MSFERKQATSTIMLKTFLFPSLAVALVFGVLLIVSICTAPPNWLPTFDKDTSLLGTLLTAQAAIAALTLAVTLFVLQGASARRDSEDRVYHEYISRSWVRLIFWGSILAVLVTGVTLIAMNYINAGTVVAAHAPGLRNLSFLAALAFLGNLLFSLLLFERAIVLSRPQRWTSMIREVNQRDVRRAVQLYIDRHTGQNDGSWFRWKRNVNLTPDLPEGSANEGIRALLEEGRRAMVERRYREFGLFIETMKELVEYAIDQMERKGIQPGTPGSQPDWPPAREISFNFYSFREEVIRQADRNCINALLGFDSWLIADGMRRKFGDLFTVGLAGFLSNHEIARRVGNADLRERLSDQLGILFQASFRQMEPAQAYPYITETIRHQERRLHTAMHADNPGDYEQLCNEFESFLRGVSRAWTTSAIHTVTGDEALTQSECDYRISLLGLGGHSVHLAETGGIVDARPYLEVIRAKYLQPQLLADDVAHALQLENGWGMRTWTQWETEGARGGTTLTVHPEMYPLTSFAIRLMELCSEPVQNLDLHGRAQQVLNWFTGNSARLQDYVRASPSPTVEERHEMAMAALNAAVLRDEVAEDYVVIGLNLSEDRIASFVSGVLKEANATNYIERLFDDAGALLLLPSDTANGPEERYIHMLELKAWLSEQPETAQTYYAPLEGDEYGRGLSSDTTRQLREALDNVQPTYTPLNSPESLLQAIDAAIEALDNPNNLVLLLSGDWAGIIIALESSHNDEYIPAWQAEDPDQVHGFGLYRGYALFFSHLDEPRQLYVVVPGEWGTLVRAEVQPDLYTNVEVKPISPDRAQDLLGSNPEYFPNEPDISSKLRKLQTCVEVVIGFRTEFRMVAPSRARRFVDPSPLDNPPQETT